MTKKIPVILLIISALFVFSACSSESDSLRGLWMDDSKDVIIHLMTENKATLAIAGQKYSGTYSADKQELTLTLEKSKENFGTDSLVWSYSLDGDKLTLTRDGSKVILNRQEVE